MVKRQRAKDKASEVVIEWRGGEHRIVTEPWARFYLLSHLRRKILLADCDILFTKRDQIASIRRIFADMPNYKKPNLP